MNRFFPLISFEFLLIYRQLTEWLNPVLFFIIVASLFPLAISPEPALLRVVAPGVIWVSVTLAILLSLDNLFRTDYEDGFLAQWCLSRYPLSYLILIRIMAASCAIIVPFLIVLPLAALFFQLNWYDLGLLLFTALLVVPTLLLVGGLGVALTISLSRSGILVALLVLPLYIPVIIFATSAAAAGMNAEPVIAPLAFLGAFAALSVTFLPFLMAFCLRNSD